MKRILAFILVALAAVIPVHAGASLVQSNSNLTFGAGTGTVTLPSVAAGHQLILVLFAFGGASGGCPIITVSDSVNGSWTRSSPGACLVETTNIWNLQMWYFPNTSVSAGTMTISAVYSWGGGFVRCYATVIDYSGLVTVSPADGSIPTELASGGAAGPTFQAPSITTTNATDLLISYTGMITLQGAGPTIDSSFTVQVLGTAGNIRSAEADRSVVATGTFAPTWTYGTNTLAMAGTAAFKVAASGTVKAHHRVIQKE